MRTNDIYHVLWDKANIKYLSLVILLAMLLLLSRVLTGQAASSSEQVTDFSKNIVQAGTPTPQGAKVEPTPTDHLPATSEIKSPVDSGIVLAETVEVSTQTFIFLPIILKSQVYKYTPEGLMLIEAFRLPPEAKGVDSAQVTITPPIPTGVPPVDTPGPGTPTYTPTPKLTLTPTPTQTPTPQLIPDGDLEGGGDQSASGWRTFSLQGHRVIFDNNVNTGPPVLPIAPFSGSAAAWLGGDDSEISFIEREVVIPFGSPFLSAKYYIHSTDPTCASTLFSDFTVATQFHFANANSLNNLQSDVGGLIITDGVTTGVATLDLCGPTQTNGWATIVYDTRFFAGRVSTIQFKTVSDFQLTSSLFIDDVSFQGGFIPLRPQSTDPEIFFLDESFVLPSDLLTPQDLKEITARKGAALQSLSPLQDIRKVR